MKTILIIAVIGSLCFSAKAQVKPMIDTTICNTIINIQKQAIQVISASNTPVDKADAARQSLSQVIVYFEQKKREIVADEKKVVKK